jgi:hypothetical protein
MTRYLTWRLRKDANTSVRRFSILLPRKVRLCRQRQVRELAQDSCTARLRWDWLARAGPARACSYFTLRARVSARSSLRGRGSWRERVPPHRTPRPAQTRARPAHPDSMFSAKSSANSFPFCANQHNPNEARLPTGRGRSPDSVGSRSRGLGTAIFRSDQAPLLRDDNDFEKMPAVVPDLVRA